MKLPLATKSSRGLRSSRVQRQALAAGALLLLVGAPFASAQTNLVWRTSDPDGVGGSGDWDTTSLNWRIGAGSQQAWVNDTNNNANFTAPTNGKSTGPVNVTTDITLLSLRFAAAGYSLSGTGVITARPTTNAIEMTSAFTGATIISNNLRVDFGGSASATGLERHIVRDTQTGGGRTLTLNGNITAFSSDTLTSAGARTLRMEYSTGGTESSPNRIVINGNHLVGTLTVGGGASATTNVVMRFGNGASNMFGIYEVNGDNSAINFGTTSANLVRGTLIVGHNNALGGGRLELSSGGGNDTYAAVLTSGARTIANNIVTQSSTSVTNQSNVTREIGGSTAHESTYSGSIAFSNAQGTGTVATTQTYRFSAVEGGRVNFTGAMSGVSFMRFEKTGQGVVNLAAVNGITGADAGDGGFQVKAGTLLVNNTAANTSGTGVGAVTVDAGATLGGGGRIAGATTVGGMIAPSAVNGGSIGTLTIANHVTWNFNTNNAWKFDLGTAGFDLANPGASDRLSISGNFVKGTGSGFAFDFQGGGQQGVYQLVNWTGSTGFNAGDFTALNLASGMQGSFSISGDALYLSVGVIPEPSAFAAFAGLGALAACGLRRSRRRA